MEYGVICLYDHLDPSIFTGEYTSLKQIAEEAQDLYQADDVAVFDAHGNFTVIREGGKNIYKGWY